MNETFVQERDRKLAEYLLLLHLLTCELERAMHALIQNSVTDFEDSITNQQAFAARLGALSSDLGRCLKAPCVLDDQPRAERGVKDKILVASASLEKLNRHYTALLKYSSHSVTLMASLFRTFQGQIEEGSGSGLMTHTWSCQI